MNKKIFFSDLGQFFILFLFTNFLFLLNADYILIIVLILLFSCILIFSRSEFSFFLQNEKLNILNNFLFLINDTKKNYLLLSVFFNLNLLTSLSFYFNIWFANNLIYRCLNFTNKNNYFFFFIPQIISSIFFLFYFPKKEVERFFSY